MDHYNIWWDHDNRGSIAAMEYEKNLKMVQMFAVSAHKYFLCNGQHISRIQDRPEVLIAPKS
jgi:hypothetical protein